MGFHSLTLCEDVDLTAFGSVQRPVLYNYSRELNAINEAQSRLYAALKELDND
jgi:hypothetical protein